MRALAKNPDARYDDCNAFARTLRETAASGGVAVRSSIPTSAMTSFVAPAIASAQGLPNAATVSVASLPASVVSSVPVSAVESSGVARVRTVTRGDGSEPADRSGARVIPHGVSGTSQGLAPNLPARMELPVVSPAEIASAVSAVPDPSEVPGPRPTTPYGSDDDEFPVVQKPSTGGRTVAVVLASVVLTITLAAAGAWGLRMFPSQRREDDIAGLVLRANEALRLGRYTHVSTGNDVEDLTDTILTLDPRNARAPEIRRNAATRLKAASDAERVAGHPDRAVDLLRDALRLVDDPTLRDELLAAQREVEAQRNAATPQPVRPTPTPRPMPRPAPRPPVREDPTLVHPVQPVEPLHPAVTPVAPPTEAPPTPPVARGTRPRRDGGQVISGPTPPPNDMSVLPPPPTRPPRPVFGDTPALVPLEPQPPPPDDEPPRTGAF
jgi:hypothetical protein